MKTDAEWEEFLARFEACTLAREEWTHAAHLAVATLYLTRAKTTADALVRTREGILRLNAHFGVPQNEQGGYHETLTVFFVRAIGAFLAGTDAATSSERIARVTARFSDKNVVLEWYDRDTINGWRARTTWIEPTRRALSSYAADVRPEGERRKFQLGLVLAGAVSGGAYTAGVLDFLFEALREVEKHRGEKDCPSHQLELRVVTGTSAGAMCAGLAVQSLLHPETPSPLRRAWVEEISIEKLLEVHDLSRPHARVISALDSTVLDHIARHLMPEPQRASFPPFVGKRLDVGLCTTLLRGIPYTIAMNAAGSYGMHSHSGEHWFPIGAGCAGGWDPAGAPPEKWWERLLHTCVASGAFPVGLAPRALPLTREEINARLWAVAGDEDRAIPSALAEEVTEFPSYYVDGGVLDNEPLELAREKLAGSRLAHSTRDGIKADRAVVMVDPFLDGGVAKAPRHAPGIFAAFGQMFAAMKESARFKPVELALAYDESVFSRFLLVPTRRKHAHDVADAHALASGVLGAFGGFLSQQFREHDYRLGRRNCQRFLQKSFALPADAYVVRDWSADAVDAHQFSDDGALFRPLVPLYGACKVEQRMPDWPKWESTDEQKLHDGLEARARKVVPALAATVPLQTLLAVGWRLLGWWPLWKARRYVAEQLHEWKLAR